MEGYVQRAPSSSSQMINTELVECEGEGCSLDITFNGGKDACVVLCPLLTVLK